MTDLHIHSTYSDGTMTPAEILKLAEQKKLQLISITDHSRVGAYQDLKDPSIRASFSGRILPGVELSTMINGQAIEILGYGIEPDQMQKFIEENYLSNQGKPRITEMDLIYDAYAERGVHFKRSKKSYSPEKDTSPKRFIYFQLLEPENRKFWLDPANMTGYSSYYRQELYNPESPLYVDYSPLLPHPQKVMDAIHNTGGKAFLAHCYLYTETVWNHLPEIAEEYGLDGIECHYPAFTAEQRECLVQFCQKNCLLISGGSDFHAKNRPSIQLGCVPVDFKQLNWIKDLKMI